MVPPLPRYQSSFAMVQHSYDREMTTGVRCLHTSRSKILLRQTLLHTSYHSGTQQRVLSTKEITILGPNRAILTYTEIGATHGDEVRVFWDLD